MSYINKTNGSDEIKETQYSEVKSVVEKKETSKTEELFKRNSPSIQNIKDESKITRVIRSLKSTKIGKIVTKFFEKQSQKTSNKRNLIDTIDIVFQEHLKTTYNNTLQRVKNEGFPPIESSNLLEPKIASDAIDTEGTFAQDFLDGDRVVIRESVVRADTVDIRQKGLIAKIVNSSIDDPGYQETLDEYESCLESTKNSTWSSTNSTRFLFEKAASKVKAKNNQAKVLVNLRMHSVQDSSGANVSQVTRSGAISDFTHGEISLEELKDFAAVRTKQNVPLFLVGSDREEFMVKMHVKAIKGYGSDILDRDLLTDKDYAVLQKIDNDERLSGDDIQVILNMPIHDEKLLKVIEKRKETLETLALQDLYLHFKTNPVKESVVLYGRTSLLDITKPPVIHKGGVIDERTQALDMKALFDGLQSRKVVFDESDGPFIDKEGIIHMPKSCSNGVKSTTLDTYYFNISVQRNTKNTGIQHKINDATLKKFEAMKDKPGFNMNALNSLIIGLDKLKRSSLTDPFEVALQTVRLANSLGGYVGVNCYGGKDRTGYLLALITDSYLPDNEKLKPKWRSELLGENGVASKIAYQNANHKALKLTQFNLLLYNVSTIQGIFNRIKDYFSIAKSIVSLNVFKAFIIRSKGQLHNV